MFKTSKLGLALVLGAGLILAACSPSGESSSSPKTSESAASSEETSISEDKTSSSQSSSSSKEESAVSSSKPDSSEGTWEDLPSDHGYVRLFKIENVPDYVDIQIVGEWGGATHWDAARDEDFFLTPYSAGVDTYFFDFGALASGALIQYKLVAVTTDTNANNFWSGEGKVPDTFPKDEATKNPIINVGSDDFATVIEGWSWTQWPADPEASKFDLTVNLALSDFDASAYDTVAVAGGFNNWNADGSGAMQATATGFTVTISDLAAQKWEFEFTLIKGDKVTYLPGMGTHFEVDLQKDTVLDYAGSIAGGVSLAA